MAKQGLPTFGSTAHFRTSAANICDGIGCSLPQKEEVFRVFLFMYQSVNQSIMLMSNSSSKKFGATHLSLSPTLILSVCPSVCPCNLMCMYVGWRGKGTTEIGNITFPITRVPRIAIAPFSDEIALQWTFCHRKSDPLCDGPYGENSLCDDRGGAFPHDHHKGPPVSCSKR